MNIDYGNLRIIGVVGTDDIELVDIFVSDGGPEIRVSLNGPVTDAINQYEAANGYEPYVIVQYGRKYPAVILDDSELLVATLVEEDCRLEYYKVNTYDDRGIIITPCFGDRYYICRIENDKLVVKEECDKNVWH